MKKISRKNFMDNCYDEATVMQFFRDELSPMKLGHNLALNILLRDDISDQNRQEIIQTYNSRQRWFELFRVTSLTSQERMSILSPLFKDSIESKGYIKAQFIRKGINKRIFSCDEIIYMINLLTAANGSCSAFQFYNYFVQHINTTKWHKRITTIYDDAIRYVLPKVNDISFIDIVLRSVYYNFMYNTQWEPGKFNFEFAKRMNLIPLDTIYSGVVYSNNSTRTSNITPDEKSNNELLNRYIDLVSFIVHHQKQNIMEWSLKSSERIVSTLSMLSPFFNNEDKEILITKMLSSKRKGVVERLNHYLLKDADSFSERYSSMRFVVLEEGLLDRVESVVVMKKIMGKI